jgi:hypothetical protein
LQLTSSVPTNASRIHRAEAKATAISTGRAVTAMTVGRTEAVAVEFVAVAVEVTAEIVVAMVSADNIVEVAMVSVVAIVEVAVVAMVSVEDIAEEAVVAMVSRPNAGIRIIFKNDLYHDTGPGEDSPTNLVARRLL